jgi:TniQ
MFLVRPRPIVGESISSWRQHGGLENGFRIFPLSPTDLRRTDPDLAPSVATIDWLSETFGVNVDEVEALTLRSLDRQVLTLGPGRTTPRWVVPLHYSRREVSYGAPFCPICLGSDARPYFRLRWRLALTSVCMHHGTLYLDRCQQCGHPAWPASAPIPALFADAWYPVHVCPVCGFDLRRTSPKPPSMTGDFRMSGELLERDVRLSASLTVPAFEYAAALWVVCQLFMRNRSHQPISSSNTDEGSVAAAVAAYRCRSVEDLPIEARHRLTTTAHRLFDDWPNKFADFCSQHDLSSEHFSEDRGHLPAWFEAVAFGSLRRQVRGISLIQIDDARSQLLREGKKVNKAAVGRLVGAVDGKLLGQLLGRRTRATEDETLELVRNLSAYMHEPMPRRSSSEVRVRNVVVILISILANKDISATVGLDMARATANMEELVAQHPADELHRQTLSCLADAVHMFKEFRQELSPKRRPQSDAVYFPGFRGGSVPFRGAQKALRECMTSLDSRLARSVRTFVVPYREVQMDLL